MSWGGCLVIAFGGFAVLAAALGLAVFDRRPIKSVPGGDRGALDAPVGPISPDGTVTGDGSRPHLPERISPR